MFKTSHSLQDNGADPAPMFATDAEIALAQRLRHELEERYFGTSSTSPPLPAQTHEVH